MAKKLKKVAKKRSHKLVQVLLPGRGKVTMSVPDVLQHSQSLAKRQQWPQVIRIMEQVTEQAPGELDAWLCWFDACHRAGDFVQMEAVAGKCLVHKPRFVPALIARGTALRMQQRHNEALADIEKAVKLESGNAAVLNHLGILQKELGHTDEALSTFNRCIAIRPDLSEAYWNRSDLLTNPNEEQLTAMQRCLQKKGLTPNQQARLHYALARAYEFLGDAEQQYRHIEQGAQCKRRSVTYDHQQEMQQMRSIPEYFTPEVLQQTVEAKAHGCTPIFISGLPRSGTTLVEQILSSHPDVVAGDELNALPLVTAQCLRTLRIDKPFPQWAPDLQPSDWQTIGRLYREHTRGLHQQRFFTDKNLQNYKAIGLIHLALPDAKIIYCRREPMDNLWGCYRQLFGDGLLFTYDQKELAETWRTAEITRQYWQQQLPDKLFVLDYEALVKNQEKETRRLLDFVGLDWHESCLRFYENPRAVKTVSAVQVRNPITTDRIGRWQRYEPWLTEMKAALGDSQ